MWSPVRTTGAGIPRGRRSDQMKPGKWLILPLLFASVPLYAQSKGVIVEEIVARVNNDVITLEDLAHARAALDGEVRDDCPNCTPAQFQTQVAEKDKNLLRDLIDQS